MNHQKHQSPAQKTHINQFNMNNQSSTYPFEIKKFDSSEDLIEKPLRSLLNTHQQIDIISEQHQQEAQTCLICFNTVSNPQMEAVPTCGHRFCKVCLNKHIRNSLHQCKIANCPLEQCNQPINYSPSFFKGINNVQQKKYARMEKYLLLINSQQQRICPKQDCEGTFSIKTNPTHCIVCNEQFCSICYHKFHQGQCDQNGIKYLKQNYRFRQCSLCKMMLQKIDGCPHMTCKCGHQFCYLCGIEWQPKHNCTGILIIHNIHNDRFPEITIDIHPMNRRIEQQPSKVCMIALLVVVIITMVICLPFDLIAFFSIRIAKGFVEMVRKYKWYQIVLGNVILLLICIAERTINDDYYCNCEEFIRFFLPISYRIINCFQRALFDQ